MKVRPKKQFGATMALGWVGLMRAALKRPGERRLGLFEQFLGVS